MGDGDWVDTFPLWAFGLSGADWELGELATYLASGSARLRRASDAGDWEMVAEQFQQLTTYDETRSVAEAMVVALNAVARLRLEGSDPIRLGGGRRYREGGAKDAWAHPEPIVVRVRMGRPTVLINGVAPQMPS